MRVGRAPHCEQHPCLIYTAHPSEVMGAKPRPGGEAPQHGGETPKDVYVGKWKVGKIQTGNSRTGAEAQLAPITFPQLRAGALGGLHPEPSKHSAVLGRAGSLSQLRVPILGSQHPHHNQIASAPSQDEDGGAQPPPEHLLPLPRRQLCRTGMVSAPVTFSSQHLGTFFLPL